MKVTQTIARVIPVSTRAKGVRFNAEKTLAQIQNMSDNSLIELYRMVRSELKSRKEDFELAAHQKEKARQIRADEERKGKLDLQKLIERSQENRHA